MTKEQLLCKLENIEKNIDYQKREFELLINNIPDNLIFDQHVALCHLNLNFAKNEMQSIMIKIKEDMNSVSEHKS